MRARFRRHGALGVGILLSLAVGAALYVGLDGGVGWPAVLAGLGAAAAFGSGALMGRGLASRGADRETAFELETARGEAALARRDGEDLQRSVAHDLRSPLGAILNFVSVLEEDHADRLGDDASAILARVRRAAVSGLVLLDGLSRLSRVSGEPLVPERVDVEGIVRGVFEGLSGGSGVELTVTSLPPAFADPALLRAAFSELLANAIKFSSHREKAHVVVGGRLEPGDVALYWVVDEGVGFDPRFASRLFGAFERLHSRDEYPGAGVGLAIVRRVAERHRGAAWAEGDPDRGARFFISVPAAAGGTP
jgi:light-regulated signal transduction histidine kinase (bacteriophytochrome)